MARHLNRTSVTPGDDLPGHVPADFPGHFPGDFPGHFPGDFAGHFPSCVPADLPGYFLGSVPRHFPGRVSRRADEDEPAGLQCLWSDRLSAACIGHLEILAQLGTPWSGDRTNVA
jgi:hypothetical protein